MTLAEFHDFVGREFAVAGQFDTARDSLRSEDRIAPLSRPSSCRNYSDRFALLDATLQHAGFAREYERLTDEVSRYCAAWVRTTDATIYTLTRRWASSVVKAPNGVVDLLRVCVLIKPGDERCTTTYEPAAARFLEIASRDRRVLVRLPKDRNTDDLVQDVTTLLNAVPEAPQEESRER